MQESPSSISQIVTNAQSELKRRSERMLHVFSFVPSDKLNWSPSPTSKSSVRIVAHCAVVCKFVADAITERLPEERPMTEDFFKAQAEAEQELVEHADVAVAFKKAIAELDEALSSITPDTIDLMVERTFRPMPMRFLLTLGQEQLATHTGQIEYLQTIWGDMDNHFD